MKVPLSWLKDYVDLDGVTVEDIAEKLTFSGIEVEGIHTIGGDLEGIVVGEIASWKAHPSADRLRICDVNDGQGLVPVVCGATNFDVGDKAAFAPVGTLLPNGMKLKKVKIRGELSCGMLCAEDELGLSDDHEGILLLPKETPTGQALAACLPPPETVLELEITWNRPDCLSMLGIARELAALYERPLTFPDTEVQEQVDTSVDDYISVRIEDTKGCPRYTARMVKDVTVEPSPSWLQQRLTLAGVRPINNVVDVTNYVMLECGHPLHAFDYEWLKDKTIVVRRARPEESLKTLDDVERRLESDMLVIADAESAVALAGVMGGAGSEIRETTRQVLLESATFDPRSIHATSTRLGLSTESSHRFERTVNQATVDWASHRATRLLQTLTGGSVMKGIVDVYPSPPAPLRLRANANRLARLLGVEVPVERMCQIFNALQIPVRSHSATEVEVDVPSFRPDLQCEADLFEEIARINGLEGIPDKVPSSVVVPGADDRASRAVFVCRDVLAGLGLSEIMNYSFLSESLLDAFENGDRSQRVTLPNPVSTDHGVLRHSLIPQMVECLERNRARQVLSAAFFETGTVYFHDQQGNLVEESRLSLGVTGPQGGDALQARARIQDEDAFLSLKGIVEQLAKALQLGTLEFKPSEGTAYTQPGTSVSVSVGGETLGFLGLLCAEMRQAKRLTDPVAIGELSLTPMLSRVFATPTFQTVPNYPSVNRDIALMVDKNICHSDIVSALWEDAPRELTAIELFDIFQGEGLERGKKSLGYSLTYQSDERTLTDEAVNEMHEAVKRALSKSVDVVFREA